MKILETLYPIRLYLTILQLEGYSNSRFIKWVSRNLMVRKTTFKKGLVLTTKAKFLFVSSLILNFIVVYIVFITINNLPASLVISLLVSSQTYIFLLTVNTLLKMPEYFIKKITIEAARNKILGFKNLKVIAITGSYGKTSTKEILYQLIRERFKTLRTPESYNTIFGISKVIDYELDNSYKFFICEMAAYGPGEISNLCYMVPPKYGILTGVTSQHLERFGSIESIIKTKFELFDAVGKTKNMIFNLEGINVREEVKKRKINKPNGYLIASDIKFSKKGSAFSIIHNGKKYPVHTNLFGFQNIVNILGATAMAMKLGMKIDYLAERIKNLEPTESRLVLKKSGRAIIVDNTYSSNEEAFKETISTAKTLKGKKALITPGLVELGKRSGKVNFQIGNAAKDVFDKTILVGKNSRTLAFAKSYSLAPDFIGDNRKEYSQTINKLSSSYDWIFLENDVTENY